jgi:hypothetical protein
VDYQHFSFIDPEMMKKFYKSDTTNTHHDNRSHALSQFVVLEKKWLKKTKKLNVQIREKFGAKSAHV